MTDLDRTGPSFVEMAHRIVWATVATVDGQGRPRGRILHPYWEWDGAALVGWVATGPTPLKRAHLNGSPFVSVTYWTPTHDTCTADCRAELAFDIETRETVWEKFKNAPAPVGYDPAIIPPWSDGPRSDAFAVLRLEPWRLRVLPGSVMLGQGGEVLVWSARSVDRAWDADRVRVGDHAVAQASGDWREVGAEPFNVVTQPDHRLGGQLVGDVLDVPPLGLPGEGELPVAVEPAAFAQPRDRSAPVLLAPSPVGLDRIGPRAVGGHLGDVRLAAVDAGRAQGDDVAVAAVFPEQRGGVPEREVRVSGPVEVAVGGEQWAAGGVAAFDGVPDQVGGGRGVRRGESRAEQVAEPGVEAGESGFERNRPGSPATKPRGQRGRRTRDGSRRTSR